MTKQEYLISIGYKQKGPCVFEKDIAEGEWIVGVNRFIIASATGTVSCEVVEIKDIFCQDQIDMIQNAFKEMQEEYKECEKYEYKKGRRNKWKQQK